MKKRRFSAQPSGERVAVRCSRISRNVLACVRSVGLVITLGCHRGAATDRGAGAIAFTHVTVIDATSPTPRLDRTVVIAGNRILAEGASADVEIPRDARVIDAKGKFLIPGLWDMHVHLTMPGGKSVLPLYVANGVTYVRDMASVWPEIQTWQREIAGGGTVGPLIVSSGPYLNGVDVPIPHLLVTRPAEAAPAVDSLIRLGVPFIKVHSGFTADAYFAIARAARARSISFSGHVPASVGAAAASDSGQASIEHLLTIPNACTPAEVPRLAPRFPVQGALGPCDSTDPAPLFAKLVRNGTAVVPTLVAQLEVARWPKRDLPGDSLQRYIPDSLKRFVQEIFPMVDSVPPDADIVGLQLYGKRVAVTGALHRAGVVVMPGTDAPLRNSPPGFGLHEELLNFSRAGISSYDVLRAATILPARFMRMQDSIGTIEAGKRADLVLLNADPLADIRNTSRTSLVVAGGRLFNVQRDARGAFVALVPAGK